MNILSPRQLAGRIFTNLVKPESYDLASHVNTLKEVGFKKAVKAIIKDEPIYKETIPGRNQLIRQSFGLKAHKKFREGDAKALRTFTDRKGKITHYELNPNSTGMSGVSINVAQKTNIVSDTKLSGVKDLVERPDYNEIMGGYSLKLPTKKRPAKYKDVWDFGVNKGENLKTYLDPDSVKDIEPTKFTKKVDKISNVLKNLTKSEKIKNKIDRTSTIIKSISQPTSNSDIAINTARTILNKAIKPQIIKGDLIAPEELKKLTRDKKLKIQKAYKRAADREDYFGMVQNGYALMNDKLLASGAMKEYSKAKKPRKVIIKNIQKSKFFSIPNPKKVITDLKETKWEKRRAENTLSPDNILNAATKQHNTAKRNTAVLGSQIAVPTALAAVGTNINTNKN